MKNLRPDIFLILFAGLCFISNPSKSQIIVETFENNFANNSVWTTITNSSNGTVTQTVSTTSSSQTITSHTSSSSTGSVTTLTSAPQITSVWSWAYSKASVLTAPTTGGGNTVWIRCHSRTTCFQVGNGGYLITPVISSGVTSISFWTSGNGAPTLGFNTNTTVTLPTSSATSAAFPTHLSEFNLSTSSFATNGTTSTVHQIVWNGSISSPVRIGIFNISAGNPCNIDDIVITSAVVTPPNPTLVTFTTPVSCQTDRLTISWTGPTSYSAANNTLLAFLKQGSAVTTGIPANAPATYTASTTFASGTPYQNDAAAYCIYNGDGTDAAGDHSGLTISGLTANTTYYLLIYNVLDAGPSYSTGASNNGTTLNILSEPSNQPTAFIKGTVTTSNIPLNWTAATGAQLADGYLINGSSSSIPAEPVDGTDPTNQTDISGGSANVKTSATSYSAFSGFTAGTMYYFRINSYTNSGGCIDFKNASSSISVAGPSVNIATLPNSVTAQAISISSGTGTIAWTTPAAYNNTNHTTLVFVKSGSSITTGTPTADPSGYISNTTLGAGTAYQGDAGANCVYNGDGTTATVTGLSAGTTYYVLILTVMVSPNYDATYSYSAAATISASPPAEYLWIGGSSGLWTVSTNWSPTRTTPASTDVLTINSPAAVSCTSVPGETIAKLTINSNCAVNLNSGSAITLSVISNNGSGDDLIITSGSGLSLASSVNLTLGTNTNANIAGTLTVNSSRTYDTDSSGTVTTVSGTIINSSTVNSTTSAKLIFNSTGIYKHARDAGTIPTGTWNTGSICWITGITSTDNIHGQKQTFSRFVWDCAGQTVDPFVLGLNSSSTAPNCVIKDSFIVYRTNGKKLQITSTGGQRDFVVGNYYQYGGKVAISYNTDAGGDQRSLTVNNTFYVADSIESGADFQLINQPAAQNVTGRLFVKGRVEMHKNISGAYLSNISTNSSAEIQFIGTANQPAVFNNFFGKIDFITNNANGVSLGSDATSYRFKLIQGTFSIGSNTLTVNGPVSYPPPGTGTFGGSSTSNLDIGSQGFAKNDSINILNFVTGAQLLKNLSLADTAKAYLGTLLSITSGSGYGTVSVDTAAVLTTNDYLTLKSDAGGTARVDKVPVNGSGVSIANIIGKVTIERYLPMSTPYTSRRWRLLTAPISSTNAPTINASWQEGATSTDRLHPVDPNPGYGTPITRSTASADGFDQGSTNNPSIYYTNPGSSTWSVPSATNTGKITDNTGSYMLFVRGDRSIVVSTQYINTTGGVNLRVKGELNTGNITTSTVPGQQVIGNPYPSSISFNGVSYNSVNPGTTIGSNYYLWDPKLLGSKGVGKWVTFSSKGTNTYTIVPKPADSAYMSQYSNTGMLESGTAFMINSLTSGSFIIHESDKINSSTTIGLTSRPVNTENDGELYSNLAFVTNANEAILADGVATIYGKDYNNDVDEQDAPKLQSFTSKETISLLRDWNYLAIERRKNLKIKDTIFFSVNIEPYNRYQLQFIGNNFDQNLTAILEDNYTNIPTVIPTDCISRYNFETNADTLSTKNTRFRIVFYKAGTDPLPVNFTNISAFLKNETIEVQWKTGNETNTKQYFIERSPDGIRFTKMGTVDALKNGSSLNLYSWLDTKPYPDMNYYRIGCVSQSGDFIYSSIVKVKTGKTPSLYVYPTKILDEHIFLQFANMQRGQYQLSLLNVLGQKVYHLSVDHPGGSATTEIRLNTELPKGMYVLDVKNPDGKVIKSRIIK